MSTPYSPDKRPEEHTETRSSSLDDAAPAGRSVFADSPGADDTAAFSQPFDGESSDKPSLAKQSVDRPASFDRQPVDRASSIDRQPVDRASFDRQPVERPSSDRPSYDNAADETQVVRPPVGGYDGPPPQPRDQVRPAYSEHAGYGDEPAVTSVYPQQPPNYAPEGYPAAYAPAIVVPPPSGGMMPEKPRSRVGPGFAGALLGLICCAAGVYLLTKFGFSAGRNLSDGRVRLQDSLLAVAGALLLLVAVVLDGWSPWSTLLPGLALTALGGWVLFDAGAVGRIGNWTRSLLSQNELGIWSLSGFTLGLGLVLVGASVAATLARASGKRDGRILGRRDAAAER